MYVCKKNHRSNYYAKRFTLIVRRIARWFYAYIKSKAFYVWIELLEYETNSANMHDLENGFLGIYVYECMGVYVWKRNSSEKQKIFLFRCGSQEFPTFHLAQNHAQMEEENMVMVCWHIRNHYNQHTNRRRLSHPSSFIVQRINKSGSSEYAVVSLSLSLFLASEPIQYVCKYIVLLNNDLLEYCFVVFAAYNVSLSIHRMDTMRIASPFDVYYANWIDYFEYVCKFSAL